MSTLPPITINAALRQPEDLYWRLVLFVLTEADRMCRSSVADAEEVIDDILNRLDVAPSSADEQRRTVVRWRYVVGKDGNRCRIPFDLIEYGMLRARETGADPIAAVFGYIRVLIEYVVRERSKKGGDVTLQDSDARADGEDPAEHLAPLEEVAQLRRFLPEPEFTALVEYHVVGGTQKEVAVRLGMTRDRLQTTLQRGRQAAQRFFCNE